MLKKKIDDFPAFFLQFIWQFQNFFVTLHYQIKTNKNMETMKFNVNGREKESYELSNKELVELIKSDTITEEQRKFLTQKVLERFEYDLCPHDGGETEEDVFVRLFSEFVNGKCHNKQKVAQGMAREHRYLQQEMFKVCMLYIKILADNANKGYYDPRNEWSCKTSKVMIDHLKEIDYWF